jgi:hypothetical protein
MSFPVTVYVILSRNIHTDITSLNPQAVIMMYGLSTLKSASRLTEPVVYTHCLRLRSLHASNSSLASGRVLLIMFWFQRHLAGHADLLNCAITLHGHVMGTESRNAAPV